MPAKESHHIDRLHGLIIEQCKREGTIPSFETLAQQSGLSETELAAALALDFSVARALRWPEARRREYGEKIRSVYLTGTRGSASLPHVIADLDLQAAHRQLKR